MLAFRIGFKYRNSASDVIMGTICAKFCAILVKICPLTPNISKGVSVRFGTRRQKSTSYQISQQVLDRTSPTFQHWLADVCIL